MLDPTALTRRAIAVIVTEIGVPALAIFASPHDVMTGEFETFD